MSEWEKAQSGKLYDAGEATLAAARARCKDLCWQLNNTRPSDVGSLSGLLAQIVLGESAGRADDNSGALGDSTVVGASDAAKDSATPKTLAASGLTEVATRCELVGVGGIDGSAEVTAPFWCDYGINIHLGKNFYCNHNTVMLDAAPIRFGRNVFVGPNCCFTTAGHPVEAGPRAEGLEYARPITVGDDVWIGAGVTVCPGVTIGSDVVIGAGSVVTHDIPSHVVAVGVPCKPIRGTNTAREV